LLAWKTGVTPETVRPSILDPLDEPETAFGPEALEVEGNAHFLGAAGGGAEPCCLSGVPGIIKIVAESDDVEMIRVFLYEGRGPSSRESF